MAAVIAIGGNFPIDDQPVVGTAVAVVVSSM